jgi:hypothetical protein
MPRLVSLLTAVVLLYATPLRGEPKPAKPEDLPKAVVAIPMGVATGATTKVTLRGLKLDGVTEVRCQEPAGKAKLLAKGSAGGVPRKEDIPRVGDTQAEVEITLPADYAGSTVSVTFTNAAGTGSAHRLIVDRSPAVAEKEPNGSFAQAQPIAIGQTVAGVVERGFDVDVYRFEGKAGQRVTAEVVAARFGSALDSLLTLYTGDGQTLAANDDLDSATTDSRLEATLPSDGAYYLVLIDANDHGSPAHVYRLTLQAKP